MTTEERLDRLERAVADLTLYTMTICQNIQPDVQTVETLKKLNQLSRSLCQRSEVTEASDGDN